MFIASAFDNDLNRVFLETKPGNTHPVQKKYSSLAERLSVLLKDYLLQMFSFMTERGFR